MGHPDEGLKSSDSEIFSITDSSLLAEKPMISLRETSPTKRLPGDTDFVEGTHLNQPTHWMDQVRSLDVFHGRMNKKQAAKLLKMDGDYLLRAAMDPKNGILCLVLSVHWNRRMYTFRIFEQYGLFYVDNMLFQTIPCLINFHRRSQHPVCARYGCLLKHGIPASGDLDDKRSLNQMCSTHQDRPVRERSESNPEVWVGEEKEVPEVLNQLFMVVIAGIAALFLYMCIYV